MFFFFLFFYFHFSIPSITIIARIGSHLVRAKAAPAIRPPIGYIMSRSPPNRLLCVRRSRAAHKTDDDVDSHDPGDLCTRSRTRLYRVIIVMIVITIIISHYCCFFTSVTRVVPARFEYGFARRIRGRPTRDARSSVRGRSSRQALKTGSDRPGPLVRNCGRGPSEIFKKKLFITPVYYTR